MVSWAAITPCIQQVTASVDLSGNISPPLLRMAPCRRVDFFLLCVEHDVTVVRRVRHEEGQQPAVPPFLVQTPGIEGVEPGRVEWQGRDRRGILQQASCRLLEGRGTRLHLGRRALDALQPSEIGIARGERMVGLEQAEESDRRSAAGRQLDGPGPQHRAGDLVLQPQIGQLGRGLDLAGIAEGRPEELQRIRREAGRAVEAALRDPGVAAPLGQPLPAHHHRAEALVGRHVMVDILGSVGLVAHHEAALAQSQVLHQERVDGDGLVAGVQDLDPPEPELVSRMQPKRRAVPDAQGLADPDAAIGADAEAHPRPRTHRLGDFLLRPAPPQIEPKNAAGEGGALDLADQDPPLRVGVLEGEEAGVRQDAGGEPARAPDEPKAGRGALGGREAAGGRTRHPRSPRSGPRGHGAGSG